MGLSNRSKLYLRKLKAQQGLQVPYIDPSGQDAFRDYYSINAPNNIEQNLQPNLQAAQNVILKDNPETSGAIKLRSQSNTGSFKIPSLSVPTQAKGYVGGGYGENDATDFADSIGESGLPFLSGWFTSVNGIRDMIYSYDDERIQKAYEKSTQEDLKQRKDQARANNFYFTPYTTGRTFQKGGNVGKMQQGGIANSIDIFMDYYNRKQDESKQSIDKLQEYYTSKNNFMRDQWMQRREKGLSNHILGGIDSFLDYWTYGADGQSLNAGTLSDAQSSVQTTNLQSGGYVPVVTADPGINSTATPLVSTNLMDDSLKMKLQKIQLDSNVDAALNRYKGFDVDQYKMALKSSKGIDPFEDTSQLGNHLRRKERYREKQDGGEIDTESLYSEDFVSPWQTSQEDQQQSQQLQDRVYADNPGMSFENNQGLQQWLWGEDPLETHTISDIYNMQYGNSNNENVSFIGSESGTEIPIKPLVDQFANIGINVGSITTGQHNVGSKHYVGKAFDIPASKNGGKEGLYKIYNYLNSAEGKKKFPNIKIINEIEAPAGKIGTGNHLHVELV